MSNQSLYPLKFNPILKSPLWGGTKLESRLNKNFQGRDTCGESWEISGVAGNVSLVANGELKGTTLVELINSFKVDLVGKACYQKFGNNFPLLIKFIDANQDLSIQVHPNDLLAMKRHKSFGKTEMWYVIDADDGSTLISGFNKQTNKEEYLKFFKAGKLTELLNIEKVYADDVFFLPAGRVHTIGKGLLVAEIQQTSDITYRIYDFDRIDKDGKKRELHVEEAIAAIDYNFYEDYKTTYDQSARLTELASCNYFITNRLITDQALKRNYALFDSFKIIMVLAGNGTLTTSAGEYAYATGDTYLIPANIKEIDILPADNSKILEVYLPS